MIVEAIIIKYSLILIFLILIFNLFFLLYHISLNEKYKIENSDDIVNINSIGILKSEIIYFNNKFQDAHIIIVIVNLNQWDKSKVLFFHILNNRKVKEIIIIHKIWYFEILFHNNKISTNNEKINPILQNAACVVLSTFLTSVILDDIKKIHIAIYINCNITNLRLKISTLKFQRNKEFNKTITKKIKTHIFDIIANKFLDSQLIDNNFHNEFLDSWKNDDINNSIIHIHIIFF